MAGWLDQTGRTTMTMQYRLPAVETCSDILVSVCLRMYVFNVKINYFTQITHLQ